MADLEFGVRRGLAHRIDYEGQQTNMYRQFAIKKQVQNEQAIKAKMFADDFDYANAINEHDNPIVKGYAAAKIQEAGAWMRKNPGWESDPMLRMEYKRMSKELRDNPDLNRGLLSDKSRQDMQAYISNPKNADLVNTPEFASISSQWDNYLKYGNQGGEQAAATEGKRAFLFVPPEEAVDTTDLLVKLAGAAEYDKRTGFGYGGYRQEISGASRMQAVEHALSSKWGKYLKKDYDKYAAGLGPKQKGRTIQEFTLERMNPYFKGDKIDKGFDPPVMKASDAAGSAGMNPNMWLTMHNKALNTPGQKIDFGPDAMQKTFGNSVGEMNLNGIKDPFGNIQNLGMRRAVATGLAQPHVGVNGAIYAEYEALVRLPVEEFVAMGPEYDKAIDEGGIFQSLTPLSNTDKNWDIHKEYQNLGIKKYQDEKGDQYVEFPVNQKYDPLNVSLADNYSNAHNVSPHKEDPYQMGNNIKVSPDGKMYQDTNTGHIYDATTRKRIQ